MEMFKPSDIKAGYLVKLYYPDDEEYKYATVIPCRAFDSKGVIGKTVELAFGKIKDGDLALCGDHGETYSTLSMFDDRLLNRVNSCWIDAVYGYAYPKHLLDNCYVDRELLWERRTPVVPPEVDLTREKRAGRSALISKALQDMLHTLGVAVDVIVYDPKENR